MRVNECAFEMEIVHAARKGSLEEWMQTHVASCPFCADAVAIDRFLNRMADDATAGRKLPDPSLLWLKSQFMQRRAAEEQALRPLAIVQRVGLFAVALGWAALIVAKWPALAGLLTSGRTAGDLVATLVAGGPSTTTIALVAALVCATATIAFQSVFAEE